MISRKLPIVILVSACCLLSNAGAQVQTSLLDPWTPTITEGFTGSVTLDGALGFAFPAGGSTTYYTLDGGGSWPAVSLPSYSNDAWLRAFIWNGEIFLYERQLNSAKGYYSVLKLDVARSQWIEVKQVQSAVEGRPEHLPASLTICPFDSSWMAIESYQEYLIDKREIYQATSPSDWRKVGTTSYQRPMGFDELYSHLQRHIYQDFYPHDVSEQNGIVWGTGFDPDVWDPNGSLPPPFPFGQYPMSLAWTRDGVHWGPIPINEADETTDLNATDWPEGLLVRGLPTTYGWAYFAENRTRLTDKSISAPKLLKGEGVMLSSWVSSSRTWSIFELVDGAFIERASGSKYQPEARLAGVWLSGNLASYDLEDWVELPARTERLIIRDDRFFDTSTGYTSPQLSPWPLANRRDIEWLEDRYYGWVHDKYYPWVYIYTFGEGLEDGWFYMGWHWDNQAYIWSDLRQEWVWVERESWPRAWSFTTEDWIGGAP